MNTNSRTDQLNKIKWLSDNHADLLDANKSPYIPTYGDITELNTCRLIMDSVGKDLLAEIAEDTIDLLDTSVAIYEANGDYAFGMFSSGWCQYLDLASRQLCKTNDNQKALVCGKWLCHENCWNDSAKVAIESGCSTDIKCVGGICLYCEPIYSAGRVIGAINIGYGNPPNDYEQLKQVAKKFEVDMEELVKIGGTYQSRPQYIIDLAKKRLKAWARLIGDTVEKEEAKRKLKEAQKRNQALLDHSPVCHKIVDLDFNLKYMSANGFKMLKLDYNAEVYGKPYPFEFFPETFQKAMTEKLKHVKKTGEIVVLEAPAKDIEGNEVWLESSLIPIFDDDGRIDYITVVSANITQRKKHEKEKKRFEEQLRQSQKMEAIGTLAGGIAHDFNNMLGIITGNISYVLSRLNKDDELYEVLTDIQESSKQAQGLTNQLLTFSKGGAPVKKVADINKIIRDAAIFSIRGAASKCIFNLSEDLWPVEVDEGQINQVVNNLVINANQAMPNGGAIAICTENVTIESESGIPLPSGRYVKIVIEDQGIGIPEKHLLNIFEPYFTTKQKGSGLGLTTTYSIIKKHEGYITVYSEIEKGTVFNIYLPTSLNDFKEPKDQKEAKHKGQGKILVMDDQEPILKMVGRMLKSMGYKTAFSADGSQAIKMYKKAQTTEDAFDAVILDLTVPGGMGGLKTIIELLKIDSNVKAIASSGYSNDPIMSNYEDYGFCGIVPKPYTKSQLAEILNNIFAEK
ncbi:ATP-binding protein [Desulfonema magnum]|uniref:histidine kinase n=1 Tax=Desulfonema magnum TaxID=45655 RepID=A0A975BXB0_9BACT|nr:ATP-binding protein [Desulfonema magnum]QTA93018.1 Two component system response regulator/histidine kinase [Desulfonema magnum]